MSRLVAALLVLLVAHEAPAPRLHVVASISPVADIARQVGGDLVEVDALLVGGVSPHTFEPTPRDMRLLAGADLFLAVGLGFEHWAEQLVVAAGAGTKRVIVSEGVPLLGGSPPNPHIWLDPVRAKVISANIAAAYASLLPQSAEVVADRRERFLGRLDSVHTWIEGATDTLCRRRFIGFHPAWIYFADRYGLEQVGVIQEFPGKEPSPRYLADLVALARAQDAAAVFAEPQLNPAAAEALAREVGVGVAVLDPIGGSRVPGRETYLELLGWNTRAMVEALRSH